MSGLAPDAATPLLDVRVRDKRFVGRHVLHELALSLAAGEIVSVVGASGCGKSTLLRLIAGLDVDYSGVIELNGQPHRSPTREIGFIFQEPRLFPWCTVADNVAFDAGGVRAGGAEVERRVEALLAEVGLAGRGGALPKQLSGGQAQRVALARGLFGQPRVLLLDEPFSAVDAFTRMRLQDALTTVVAHHGIAALLVTHDIDEAVHLSDRIIVMEADPGRIRAEIDVPLLRPRERAQGAQAALRRRVLEALEAVKAL